MKKITILLLCFIGAIQAQAQDIKFTVNNMKDTTIYLAKYFGEKLYYADTADFKKGEFHFDGSKHPLGLYAAILPGPQIVQFIIDNEKVDMTIPNQKDIVGSMVVNKSKNNKIFYDYIKFMTENRKASMKIDAAYGKAKNDKEKEKLREESADLNKEVLAYQKGIIKDNSNLFIGKMIGMSIDIDLPEAPKDKNGIITDSSFLYNYNMAHFWDNVDLTNEDIVRTPAFHSRLEKYYSKAVMLQIPDSIIKYTDNLLARTKEGTTPFQYIIHFVTNKYERSEIMGMDKVFVHMADTYYGPKETTKAFWMSDESLDKVIERANKLRPLIIGEYAPRLILPDSTEKNWIDFYTIKSDYKILYFWDPNCGHCKKTTPKLQNLYAKKLKDRNVEVYAIAKATGNDFEAWKKYIRENELTFTNVGLTKNVYNEAQVDARKFIPKLTNIESLNYTSTYDIFSTPRIFILDSENRIMYKRLSISQVEEILDREQGIKDAEILYPRSEEEDEEGKTGH